MTRANWLLRLLAAITLAVVLALGAACGDDDDDDTDGDSSATATADSGGDDDDGGPGVITGEGEGDIEVTSTSFEDGGEIPEEFTCSGDDVAPPVSWTTVPEDTKSLVLVMDDPDADGFVHWLVYDIPAKVTGFAETPDSAELPSGAKQGVNGFGDVGYGGPCPPDGEEHEYRLRVLALDAELGLDPGATAGDVNSAIEDAAVLDEGKLTGTFAK
jgi:Raf kinase inhibitor-like YbhB/YbcL family protein